MRKGNKMGNIYNLQLKISIDAPTMTQSPDIEIFLHSNFLDIFCIIAV